MNSTEYATPECRRRATAKYRKKNLAKYAEYKRDFYSKNPEYVEREKKRLKERYEFKKDCKVFLNILLE